VTAGLQPLGQRLRAQLRLSRAPSPPQHVHRLDLPPERAPGASVPTGRCDCGAIGIPFPELAGPEWEWLQVVAPDLADRVVWLPPGQYAAALHRVSQQLEGDDEERATLVDATGRPPRRRWMPVFRRSPDP
jgi:hypothetical protein